MKKGKTTSKGEHEEYILAVRGRDTKYPSGGACRRDGVGNKVQVRYILTPRDRYW
jgi:hypothetical protein